jgi:hypothetical protein
LIITNSIVPTLSNINKEYSYDTNSYPVHFTTYYYGNSVGLIKQYSADRWKLLAGQCPLNCSLVYTNDDDFYGETLENYIKRGEHIKDFGVPEELVTRQDQRMATEITKEKPRATQWNEHISKAFKRGTSTAKYCRDNCISRSQLYKWRASLLEMI